MNNNVRIVSAAAAAASAPDTFRTVNISTSGNNNNQWQTCTQLTAAQYAACPPGEIPTVVAGPTGAAGAIPNNGLKTILVSGYTAPS